MLKKLIYLIRIYLRELMGKSDYWHPKLPARKDEDTVPDKYYLDFSQKANYTGPYNADNVPLVRIGGAYREFAITIFNYGLGILENPENYRININAIVVWALKTQDEDGLWKADFGDAYNCLDKGWVSAMAQGLGISFLSRASHYVSDDLVKNKIILSIERAFNALIEDERLAGSNKETLQRYFQEFGGTNKFVLNGHIFAIYGIMDYFSMHGDNKSFNNTIEESIKFFSQFSFLGIWTKYSDSGLISSRFYHELHIEMLKSILQKYDDKSLQITLRKWQVGGRFAWFFITLKAFNKLANMKSVNILD